MGSFQDRLKQVRGKITQADMSDKLGIPFVSYGRYERGERSPDLEFIEKVCQTFDISPTWLILGEGPMHRGEASEAAPAAPASPLDQGLLQSVLAGVKKGLAWRGTILPPDKEAELIALLYDHYAKIQEKPDEKTVERYLKLAV